MFASVADMRNDGKSKNEKTASLKDSKHTHQTKITTKFTAHYTYKIPMSRRITTPCQTLSPLSVYDFYFST